MVYGRRWAGRLSVLNVLPPRVANTLFAPIAALKPVVHVNKIASFVLSSVQESGSHDICLFDDKDCNPFYRAVRRCGDFAAGLIIVCLMWWLYLPIWALVRLQSSGPGIFAQARVGQGGKDFTCYKFRTMKVGTPQLGTHEVNPSSITVIGSFLRRWKLDELPQVINLFRGEMTLVGPRPCLPEQTDVCLARKEAGVDVLRPGITGLSQIQDVDMSNPARLAFSDARYRATRGLILDLAIVLNTLGGKGRSDRVRISANQPAPL
ncbi:sugar transferase [Novosphingobium sp. 1Y9A]|uniref:Sugar transferase n=2 Tax=Novosphingobium jiangmenense TaxID=2791981 RepID=A0ABS0HIR5_9SPHN|nr:sugar transferase [Novosphingobium jiangmenense]